MMPIKRRTSSMADRSLTLREKLVIRQQQKEAALEREPEPELIQDGARKARREELWSELLELDKAKRHQNDNLDVVLSDLHPDTTGRRGGADFEDVALAECLEWILSTSERSVTFSDVCAILRDERNSFAA